MTAKVPSVESNDLRGEDKTIETSSDGLQASEADEGDWVTQTVAGYLRRKAEGDARKAAEKKKKRILDQTIDTSSDGLKASEADKGDCGIICKVSRALRRNLGDFEYTGGKPEEEEKKVKKKKSKKDKDKKVYTKPKKGK